VGAGAGAAVTTWYRERAPHPALDGAVRRYTGFEERTGAPVAFRELPVTVVPVILDLGEGWHIGDPRRPDVEAEHLGSFVAGLTDGPVLVRHEGWARCLQVDLEPLAARRLLGMPMTELTNRSVPLEDVLGAGARRLLERLAGASGWEARFSLVDDALVRRLAAAAPLGAEVGWALARLEATAGGEPIGRLSRELGWSPRRLIRRFRDELGLPPKLVARILRFERLHALVRTETAVDWARTAAACGYFDQAHLAREVRDLADLTPSQLLAGGVNSVQEATVLAA
jgi:AraC-like DNA-binding protein